jgi:hypothetical protein
MGTVKAIGPTTAPAKRGKRRSKKDEKIVNLVAEFLKRNGRDPSLP